MVQSCLYLFMLTSYSIHCYPLLCIAAITVLLCPVISNQQRYSWDRRRQRACLAWLGMPGVISVRGLYDVQSPANEAPSASFAKAIFSEAVKVIIARKTIYWVHYDIIHQRNGFRKRRTAASFEPATNGLWVLLFSLDLRTTQLFDLLADGRGKLNHYS